MQVLASPPSVPHLELGPGPRSAGDRTSRSMRSSSPARSPTTPKSMNHASSSSSPMPSHSTSSSSSHNAPSPSTAAPWTVTHLTSSEPTSSHSDNPPPSSPFAPRTPKRSNTLDPRILSHNPSTEADSSQPMPLFPTPQSADSSLNSPNASLLSLALTTAPTNSLVEETSPSSFDRGRQWHVLMEIVESERAYAADLNVLVDIYLQTMQESTSLPLTTSQKKTVALNVKALRHLHEKFATELESSIADHPGVGRSLSVKGKEKAEMYTPGAQRAAIQAIAHHFLELSPKLGLYQTYGAGHTDAVDIIRRIQHKPEWIAFERQCSILAANFAIPLHPSHLPPTAIMSEDIEDSIDPPSVPEEPGGPSSLSTPLPDASASRIARSLKRKSLRSLRATSTLVMPAEPKSSRLRSEHRRRSSNSMALSIIVDPIDSTPATPTTSEQYHEMVANARLDLPASIPPPSASPRSANSVRLSFQDLLIKPIQRVCRYPLLLEQLRSAKGFGLEMTNESGTEHMEETLDAALEAMKKVARDVDDAREKRDSAVKSQLILERLETHPTISQQFVRSLGRCMFASSLDMVYHHTSISLTSPIKVKLYGALLYQNFLVLVKARKSKGYEPRQALSLERAVLVDVINPNALLTNSFRLTLTDHTFEFGTSCLQEKALWLAAIKDACKTIESTTSSAPISTISTPTVSSPTSPVLTVESFGSEVHIHFPRRASVPGSQPALPSEVPQDAPPSVAPTTTSHSKPSSSKPSPSRRASVVSGPSTLISQAVAAFDPTFIPIRRPTAHARTIVDRNLVDVSSNAVLAARAYAQLRGELFKAPAAATRVSIPSAFKSKKTPQRRSFLEATAPSSSTLPIGYRKPRRSTPKEAILLPPLVIGSPLNMPGITTAPASPVARTNAVPRRRSQSSDGLTRISAPPTPISADSDASDQETVFVFDDGTNSSTHTPATSEETHGVQRMERTTSLSGSVSGTVKLLLGRRSTWMESSPKTLTTRFPLSTELRIDEGVPVVTHGRGLTNKTPSPHDRSLFRRSLTAMTIRRRTKSSPTVVSPVLTQFPTSSTGTRPTLDLIEGVSPIELRNSPAEDKNPELLSPYWSTGPPLARASSPVVFETLEAAYASSPSLVSLSQTSTSPSRSGMELFRVNSGSKSTPAPPQISTSVVSAISPVASTSTPSSSTSPSRPSQSQSSSSSSSSPSTQSSKLSTPSGEASPTPPTPSSTQSNTKSNSNPKNRRSMLFSTLSQMTPMPSHQKNR